jgi:hypothetical protein
MRGTDDVGLDIVVERCRASFDLKHADARTRTQQALARAHEQGDAATARELGHLLRENRSRRLEGDDGPTAETLVFRRHGNRHDTLRLLSFQEQIAARQIANVVEALTAPVACRTAQFELGSRVDGSCNGGMFMPERMAERYHHRYLPWVAWMTAPASTFVSCRACGLLRTAACSEPCSCGSQRIRHDRPHLALVLSIVVFGAGLEQCSGAYGMRRETVLRLLRLGLARYADFG